MKNLALILSAAMLLASLVILHHVRDNDGKPSKQEFKVTKFDISDVSGVFNNFDLKLTSSKPDFSDAVFELIAKGKSTGSQLGTRDFRLKSDRLFDAANFHKMHFYSTSVRKTGNNRYKLTGDLSLQGVKKQVNMDLVCTGKVGK